MNISPRDILFRCGPADLTRYGRLTRTLYPEELSTIQFKETFSRASTKNVFGPDGLLRGASNNIPGIDWADANTPTLLLEPARTNIVLWNRDLTNAAWTKTNVSAVKDQTGIDGVASSASRITASAGNGTCLQAITLGSSQRFQSCYIKRLVGSGTIQMTTDNGSIWTAVTVTGAWTRVSIPAQTLANPTVGFRIVTNADSVAIDFVQNETSPFATSPIATTTVAVTRAVDDTISFPYQYEPQGPIAIYYKGIEAGAVLAAGGSFPGVITIGAFGTWRNLIAYQGGAAHYKIWNDSAAGGVNATLAADPSIGQSFELLGHIYADGSVQLRQSIAGGAETATAISSTVALPPSFGTFAITIGGGGYSESIMRVISVKVIRGTPTSIADVRNLP